MQKQIDKFHKRIAVMIFIMIFFSHDTTLFGTNVSPISGYIRQIVPLVLCIILLFYNRIMDRKAFVIIVLFEALPMITCVVTGESFNNYIYKFFIILTGFLFALLDLRDEFEEIFIKIIFLISCWSLVQWGISIVEPSVLMHLPKVTNSAGTVFYNSFFTQTISSILIHGLPRNFAIFREPGVFAVFLNIVLFFELKRENVNKSHVLVFVVALITTFSTTGYIIGCLIGMYMVIGSNMKYKGIYVGLMCACIMFLVLTETMSDKLDIMFDKFRVGSNSYGSFYARAQSILGNLEICINNPIFGIGRYHLYDTVLGTMGNYEAIDNTNTITINYAAFGVLYGTLNLIGILKYVKNNTSNIVTFILVAITFLLALANEDLNQNIFYYYLVFSGLLSFRNCRINTEKEY